VVEHSAMDVWAQRPSFGECVTACVGMRYTGCSPFLLLTGSHVGSSYDGVDFLLKP